MTPRPGRLAPGEMFPAGWPGLETRWLTTASGLRIRAVVSEPAAPSPRRTALFVHGWACSAYTWRHVLKPVAEAGIRAIAVDLPGHGLSDKPVAASAYSLVAMTTHVRDILDALGLERPLVVGHSMGGAIALRLAMEWPERVAGLVLPAPVGLGAIRYMRVVPWLTPSPTDAMMPYVAFRWAVRLGLWRSFGRIGSPTERDVDEYWAPSQDPAFSRAMRLLARAFTWAPIPAAELGGVTVPVSMLLAERDHLVRLSEALPIARQVAGARIETIGRAGHALPDEVPAAVVAAVLDAATVWESRFS